jgi:hypothetical protein
MIYDVCIVNVHSMLHVTVFFSLAEKNVRVVTLSMQETFCLPTLLYASAGYSFKKRQLTELNSCWITMYRKIFHLISGNPTNASLMD